MLETHVAQSMSIAFVLVVVSVLTVAYLFDVLLLVIESIVARLRRIKELFNP